MLTVGVRLREGGLFDFDGWSFGEVREIWVLFGLVLNVMLDLVEFLSEIELILRIGIIVLEVMRGGLLD